MNLHIDFTQIYCFMYTYRIFVTHTWKLQAILSEQIVVTWQIINSKWNSKSINSYVIFNRCFSSMIIKKWNLLNFTHSSIASQLQWNFEDLLRSQLKLQYSLVYNLILIKTKRLNWIQQNHNQIIIITTSK